MPIAATGSRQMATIIPENGYESPPPSPHGGSGLFSRPKQVTGRRLAYTSDAPARKSRTNIDRDGGQNQQPEVEEGQTRIVGFRDRIGCYT
jgi:hypothetical protein